MMFTYTGLMVFVSTEQIKIVSTYSVVYMDAWWIEDAKK